MDPRFTHSFIPKKPIGPGQGKTHSRKGRVDMVSIIVYIVFAVAIILSVGVVVYKEVLKKDIETTKHKVARARDSLDLTLLDEFKVLDRKIKSAEAILENHIAPTAIFDLLESGTLASVRFSNFDFNILPGESAPKLRLQGEARNLESVAAQSAVFKGESGFGSVKFFAINQQKEGKVSFETEANLNTDPLKYSLGNINNF